MAISFLSNPQSVTIQRHLEQTSEKASTSLERIASGRRINRAGDDAAGLAIAEGLRARYRGVQRARQNAMDGLSLVQVAEGGMNEASNLLIRLRELSIQSASDTVSNKERKLIQLEVNQIKAEMNRLAEATRYSETALLNGEGGTFEFQIGPDNNENNRVTYEASKINIKPDELGVDDINLEEKDDAREAIEALDGALVKLQSPRAEVAALQTRLHTISRQLVVENENLMAAHGRIVDADLAKESSNMVRAQTAQAAGVAVLAQANQLPAVALRLING